MASSKKNIYNIDNINYDLLSRIEMPSDIEGATIGLTDDQILEILELKNGFDKMSPVQKAVVANKMSRIMGNLGSVSSPTKKEDWDIPEEDDDKVKWFLGLTGDQQQAFKSSFPNGEQIAKQLYDRDLANQRAFIAEHPWSDANWKDYKGDWNGPLDNPLSNWLGSAYMGLMNRRLKNAVKNPPEGDVPSVPFLSFGQSYQDVLENGKAPSIEDNPVLADAANMDRFTAQAYGAFPAGKVGQVGKAVLGTGGKIAGDVVGNAVVPTAVEAIDAKTEDRDISLGNIASGTAINFAAGKAIEGLVASLAGKYGIADPAKVLEKLQNGKELSEQEMMLARDLQANGVLRPASNERLTFADANSNVTPLEAVRQTEQFLDNMAAIREGRVTLKPEPTGGQERAIFDLPEGMEVLSTENPLNEIQIPNTLLKGVNPRQEAVQLATMRRQTFKTPTKDEAKAIFNEYKKANPLEYSDKDFEAFYEGVKKTIDSHNKSAAVYNYLWDPMAEYGGNWLTNRAGDTDLIKRRNEKTAKQLEMLFSE